ncbi:MAG TPA: organic hydroperoxide resistance protein [Candidatus Dormibacteraeota bacterium]|nr:organic hydroperoxide resistance protein [Candidatus Dormibacteraeota bacterium]
MTDTTTKPLTRVLYTAEATVNGGRKGHGKTSDARLEVDFSSPTEMGGDGGPGTNPEQLFALGYAACYQSALLGIARRKQLTADDSTVRARVGLGTIGEGRFGISVELHVTLPSIGDRAAAQDLVEEADQRCPYSNAVRGNVPVTITVD